MGLGDDLLASPNRQELCGFGQFIEASEYKEQLLAAIARILDQRTSGSPKNTYGYTVPWLVGILQKNDIHDFSRYQIQRHIAGECACGRHLALVANGPR